MASITAERFFERREFRRYLIKGLAFVVLGPNYTEMGQIVDISRDGLSFRYIENDRRILHSHELDIMLSDERFYLDRIPHRMVRNLAVVEGYTVNPMLRRCCVQFGDLLSCQINKIEQLLRNNTIYTGEIAA